MPELAAAPDIPVDDDFLLFELAAWSPAGLDAMLRRSGLPQPSRPGDSATAGGGLVLRITSSLAWVMLPPGREPAFAPAADGVVVELSNSRVRLKLRGPAAAVLPRLVAVDFARLRPDTFAASLIHGIPVTILPMEAGFDLYVPRSFAVSLVEWIGDAARPA